MATLERRIGPHRLVTAQHPGVDLEDLRPRRDHGERLGLETRGPRRGLEGRGRGRQQQPVQPVLVTDRVAQGDAAARAVAEDVEEGVRVPRRGQRDQTVQVLDRMVHAVDERPGPGATGRRAAQAAG